MNNLRICYLCKIEKSLDQFYKGKAYKDGYDIYCKECAREKRRNNSRNPTGKRNPIKVNKEGLVWCTKCKQYKNKELFHINNSFSRKTKYPPYCKDCDNLRNRNQKHTDRCKNYYITHVKNNPTKFKEERIRKLEVWNKYKNTPRWRANKARSEHNRRTNIKNSIQDLTATQIEWLLKFQNNRCGKCGITFSPTKKYEIDHVVPVSKGGNLTISNVQLLCKSCNCSKGDNEVRYIQNFNYVEVNYG